MPGIQINLTVKDDGTRAIRKVHKEIGGLDRTTKKVGKTFSQVSGQLKNFAGLLGIGLGFEVLRRGIVDTINVQREYGAALSDLSAITGATGKQLGFLDAQSRQFGRTTTLSATEAVVAFKLIASAKPDLLESSKGLAAITREAITLAEAATIDMPLAAKTLGASLNQFDLAASQSSRVINVLAAGAKFGASEIAQTAEALRESGTVAAAAGVSFEETNAAIQTLASVSIVGSQAGTNLRNVILKLQTEGIDQLDPSVVGLAQALKNLGAQELSTTELTKIFGLESVTAAKVLIDQADSLGTLTEKLTGTATATEQAATKTNTLDGDIDRLSNAYVDLQLTVSKTSEKSLRGFFQTTTETINVVNNLTKTLAAVNGVGNPNVNEIDARIEGLQLQRKFLEDTLESEAKGNRTFFDRVFVGPERALKIQLESTKSKLEVLDAQRRGLLSLEEEQSQPGSTEKSLATIQALIDAEKKLKTETDKTSDANEKTQQAALLAAQAILTESATLDTLKANVEPAIDALGKLQSQQQDLAQQEIALAAQRAQIVGQSQVLIRSLFAPEIPRFDEALEEQLQSAKSKLEQLQNERFDLPLFGGERQRDVLGAQIEETKRQISELSNVVVPVDQQFLQLEDTFQSLVDEAGKSSGLMREAVLKEAEALLPQLKTTMSKLFPDDVVRSEIEDLVGELTTMRVSVLGEQRALVDSQQALVEESLAIVEQGVSAVGSQMAQLFQSIEQQSSSTTGKILTDFQALLESVRQAQLTINDTLFAGPQGLASIQSPPASGLNAPASFAVGTPFVPRDMLANIHRGEAIIPAADNPFNGRSAGAFAESGQLNMGNVSAVFTINIQGEGLPTDQAAVRQWVRDQLLPEMRAGI